MKRDFHYNTVKVLAVHAGFSVQDAQYIAYFSQQVDDFIMHAPFITDSAPPPFFIENRLARKLRIRRNRWVFLPCTTGINMLRTLSSSYRLHTLMPFHFIMPRPFYTLNKNAERSLYRCISANRGEHLLVNQRVKDIVQQMRTEDFLIALGITLHTFADSYAHEGFSGFQGWENAAHVHAGLRSSESLFFRTLPSIGHANAGSLPDECTAKIEIHAKRTEKSPYEPLIVRDNAVFFADCARRICDILCMANQKSPLNNSEWGQLSENLTTAQTHNTWEKTFPGITFAYKKNEFLRIRLETLRHDAGLLNDLEINPDGLHDVYCENADRARFAALTLAHHVNDDFFRYNEAAYRHIHAVIGEYSAHTHRTHLAHYCEIAEAHM
ncbi:MAG: hypothetical protein FWC71_00360 [Defluviitaleaceae bacterium]|nr:hypothetical protein [Defluviitaleaceae bacterium]